MKTLGSELEKYKGIGPGFDFLRIFLALSVLFTHSVINLGRNELLEQPPIQLLYHSILPMFFALSGFLITGSALRLKLNDFILNRGMRIVPALAVDIFISALVLGPFFTILPLSTYFKDPGFIKYFANIFGWIHYTLPGVFLTNPYPNIVNGSLWTVPFEIFCYFIISLFIIFSFLKNKSLALTFTVIIGLIITGNIWLKTSLPIPDNSLLRLPAAVLAPFFLPRGQLLYVYFLVGCIFYLFRYQILFDKRILFASLAIIILGTFGAFNYIPEPLQNLIYYPVIVYITVFVGLLNIPRLPIYSRGDYSYGIYLYGGPIQQAIISIFPMVVSTMLHFAISLVITSGVAMISWHYIEKPILGLRRKFSFTARKGDETLIMPHPEGQ